MKEGIYISKPYVSQANNKYCMTGSFTIKYQGNIKGVISIDMNI